MEAKAYRRRSRPLYQTTQNVEGLESHTHSFEHLEGSTKGLDKLLQGGFIMEIKMGQVDSVSCWQTFESLCSV